MASLEGVDPFDPAILSSPESFWAKLRRDAPIYRVDLPGADGPVFFVTRHADVDHIATRPETFSSRAKPAIFRWPDQPEEFDAVFHGQKFASTFVTSDPPEHRQYRRVADAGLGLGQIRKWKPMLEGIVDALVADLPENEPFDFVGRWAVPLPSNVIRTILDLPLTDGDFLVWFTDEYMAMVDPSTPMAQALQHAEGVRKAQEYLIPRIHAYRRDPGDNFFSIIANARREDGELMSIEEVLSMVIITIIGGNETTRNALSSMAFYLATSPGLWRSLKDDRSLVGNFVNEAIRLSAPSNFLPRTALADTEMHGVAIPRGSTLFLLWGSANRDETTFDNPDAVDLQRRNARANFTFGKGPHFCAGNHLARMEMMLTAERLLDDFETFALAVPEDAIRYEPIMSVRTLRSLPVRVTRSKDAAAVAVAAAV